LAKPPFFPQAYPFSCVPACLRMVLASLDSEKSEAEIRSFCDCDETGTSPLNAILAVIEFGFDAYQANLVFEELEDLVSQNITPIVFTKVAENVNYSHAIVIYKISGKKVFAIDPEIGERKIDTNQFIEIWSRGLTIIIAKKTE
jgi:ABC-type bacteriocin/lantibiotic exporter with double-glycine peptidase domain